MFYHWFQKAKNISNHCIVEVRSPGITGEHITYVHDEPRVAPQRTKIKMKIFPVYSFVHSVTSTSTCSQSLITGFCPPSLQHAALAPTKRRPQMPTAPSVLHTARRHKNKPWSAPVRKVSIVPRPILAPWPARVRDAPAHHCNDKHISTPHLSNHSACLAMSGWQCVFNFYSCIYPHVT